MADNAAPGSGDALELPQQRDWKFTQWFRKSPNEGNGEPGTDDAFDISSVQFDETGDFLATGDNSGNIVVLKNSPEQAKAKDELVRYIFHCEFQSHYQEFDYVSSQPISERINNIKWGPKTCDALYLLSTSCKHIKLWKIQEREPMHCVNFNFAFNQEAHAVNDQGIPIELPRITAREQIIKELKVPKIEKEETCAITTLKKWYPYEGHMPTINHLGITPDKENFVSADFFKINMWDLFRNDGCYTIADMFPKDGTPPKEVITTMDYHPTSSHLFAYGSNLGKIRMCDLRYKSHVESPTKIWSSIKDEKRIGGIPNFNLPLDDEETSSLFDEVTCGMAGVQFSKGGRYIISRDFMSIKLWDVNYEKRPLETIYVHEYLRENLFELYNGELLADAFSLGVSARGDIVTGTYSNHFHLFELSNKRDVFIQASRDNLTVTDLKKHNKKRMVSYIHPQVDNATMKKKNGMKLTKLFASGNNKNNKSKKNKKPTAKAPQKKRPDNYPLKFDYSTIEFDKKILDCAWHPETNAVAVTGQNSLFIYSK